ncbi:uncharacterized protein LOC120106947 isoform X1 [Phoenix dactylifera]|uniref:Uncharacterized protein LOC120106947 isoform X1 n=1 Tax=Phoenix dactylifera TaxID=42345 RepID=A0A8B8ZXE7_PHODC|nr:uncharacterized protein LOC120106947 isoform X1 [Phoenix dactylifera]
MEERGNLSPNQNANPNPPNQEAGAPPAAAAAPPAKKRKLEDGGFRNTPYYKIRSLVRDLRPLFLELLQTPDFRNSKAAHDIRNQMKIMLELLKQLNTDITAEEEKRAAQTQTGEAPNVSDNIMAQKRPQGAKVTEVTEFAKQLEEVVQETYMIGGSPVGWNFLVYPGSKPLYYGVTKANVLARRAAK